ncbi:MAG: methylenetetrahydrofolate reductase C-terminal domain-containing protein [Myxococcales bacterium]|nr:methylenetetrahydrofolate reductase C-terminal domain-containing protein [Myxococcales bacterium]MDH5306112.1 methylenetetrahydrofolate reductase C-terminal domain-containing protein [Myxococcales bacterium]MDH5567045.1 methylenetetrahydrofolate reductase C-terminal domain-containing protein [Myxococcales bacterium]
MRIGRWLQDHPRLLERAYRLHHWGFLKARGLLARIGYERVDRWIRGPEELGKRLVFDCRMCGQCVLHSTGMTCPMTCPKNLRNGPCGGVRSNGHCEVLPEMKCVWVEAFERSQRMPLYGKEMLQIQPPLNHQLEGSSSWVTLLAGRTDPPRGWLPTREGKDA